MDINDYINSLMDYAMMHNLMSPIDYDYLVNDCLEILKLDEYIKPSKTIKMNLDEILDGILNFAINNDVIENTNENKDLLDSKIMGIFALKPSEMENIFYAKYEISPVEATDYFYKYCKDINYIRSSRIAKDIHFSYKSNYGKIDISINMSKPEKDPNDIKKLLTLKKSGYPKCMLCKENINYAGHLGFPCRKNLSYVGMELAGSNYYMQYSPYSYFNEHCIVFHEDHFNMRINKDTFNELTDFVLAFPHYFLGSNAGLPIVGGSILNHEHYQGGREVLPMQKAKETFLKKDNNVDVYLLSWPMNVIRIRSDNQNDLVNYAMRILTSWQNYENKELNIINNKDEIHNTITPIARINNKKIEMDLVLRNNLTTIDRPLGLFHPSSKYWHIKKENIGLIEVMGLAILPSRLKSEMEIVKKYLLDDNLNENETQVFEKHKDWANQIKDENKITKNNVEKLINDNIAKVFVKVLEDCAIFKKESQDELIKFVLKA